MARHRSWTSPDRRAAGRRPLIAICVVFVVVLITSSLSADEPGLLREMHAQCRPGGSGWVDVHYSLSADLVSPAWVVLSASTGGDDTCNVMVRSVVGDVGRLDPGTGRRRLHWHALADAPNLFAQDWQVALSISLSPPTPKSEDMIHVPTGVVSMGSEGGAMPTNDHDTRYGVRRFS